MFYIHDLFCTQNVTNLFHYSQQDCIADLEQMHSRCIDWRHVAQVFDDKSTFTEWFGDSLGKASDGAKQEDEWLETEKRVVVIHRLHQILEPFMLRRQVEDVESKLPPKVCSNTG